MGASTNAGKAGSVQAINVSLGKDSPVVTFDRVEVITSLTLLKLYLNIWADSDRLTTAGASLLQSSPPRSWG